MSRWSERRQRASLPDFLSASPPTGHHFVLEAVRWLLYSVRGVSYRSIPRHVRQVMPSRVHLRASRQLIRQVECWSNWCQHWRALAEHADICGDSELAVFARRMEWHGLPIAESGEIRDALRLAYMSRADLNNPVWFTVKTGDAEAPCILEVPPGASVKHCVLFVSGFRTMSENFHRFSRQVLQQGIPICRMDLPGMTGEVPNDTGHLVNAVSDHLARVYDVEHLHLFGYCLGASLALHAAAERTPASLTTVSAVSNGNRYLQTFFSTPFELIAAGVEDVVRDESGAITRLPSALSVPSFASRITCPTLMIHGMLDLVVSARDMLEIARVLPEWPEMMLVPTAGHGPIRGAKIADRYLAFLKRCAIDAESYFGQSAAAERDAAA